jgi:hypothetical protein
MIVIFAGQRAAISRGPLELLPQPMTEVSIQVGSTRATRWSCM